MVGKIKNIYHQYYTVGFPDTDDSMIGFYRSSIGLHLPAAEAASALGKDAGPPGRVGAMRPSPKEDIWSCVLLGLAMLMLQALDQFLKPSYRC